ncbi:MAG: helix-turn-helix domain-containing protein, partial [Bacteroidota bacterium]
YALLFIMEGEGQHYIDFKSYQYQRGSLIFISKEQVHAFEQNRQREAFFLLFTRHFLEKSSLASNLMQQLSLYNYHLYPPVLQLSELDFPVFSDLVMRIHSEYHAPDDQFTEEIIQSSLKILLSMAERIRKRKRKKEAPSRYQDEFLQFQRLLDQHILDSRMVHFYAQKMNISTKKLNRIVQEIMHQPAKNYINEILIIEMKRLLMNTNFSIKEIAYKTGFEDPTNFTKYFKKWTHQTPAIFRKSY